MNSQYTESKFRNKVMALLIGIVMNPILLAIEILRTLQINGCTENLCLNAHRSHTSSFGQARFFLKHSIIL